MFSDASSIIVARLVITSMCHTFLSFIFSFDYEQRFKSSALDVEVDVYIETMSEFLMKTHDFN